jgi:endonuclease/exonuclease/phosphatase family metal-dependent hydrolase
VELGRLITEVDHGRFRSALTGQANAILLAHALRVRQERTLTVSRSGERRVCQAVRVADVGLIGNVHVTGGLAADEQFLRAAAFVDALAEPGEPVILAGDVNIVPGRGDTYGELEEWGFSRPLAASIDQILVRGAPSTSPEAWPEERRRVGGRRLSDHAPVELRVG